MFEKYLLIILVFGSNGSADTTVLEVGSLSQCQTLGKAIVTKDGWFSQSGDESFYYRNGLHWKCVKV